MFRKTLLTPKAKIIYSCFCVALECGFVCACVSVKLFGPSDSCSYIGSDIEIHFNFFPKWLISYLSTVCIIPLCLYYFYYSHMYWSLLLDSVSFFFFASSKSHLFTYYMSSI